METTTAEDESQIIKDLTTSLLDKYSLQPESFLSLIAIIEGHDDNIEADLARNLSFDYPHLSELDTNKCIQDIKLLLSRQEDNPNAINTIKSVLEFNEITTYETNLNNLRIEEAIDYLNCSYDYLIFSISDSNANCKCQILNLLKKITQNILNSPHDPKYRRITLNLLKHPYLISEYLEPFINMLFSLGYQDSNPNPPNHKSLNHSQHNSVSPFESRVEFYLFNNLIWNEQIEELFTILITLIHEDISKAKTSSSLILEPNNFKKTDTLTKGSPKASDQNSFDSKKNYKGLNKNYEFQQAQLNELREIQRSKYLDKLGEKRVPATIPIETQDESASSTSPKSQNKNPRPIPTQKAKTATIRLKDKTPKPILDWKPEFSKTSISEIHLRNKRTGASHSLSELRSIFDDMEYIGKMALDYTNYYRSLHSMIPLVWDHDLMIIAEEHSANMANGTVPIGHQGSQGRFTRYPYYSRLKGENVAMVPHSYEGARNAVNGWILSPGHEKNLRGYYNRCGIGVAIRNNKYYLTQLFGFIVPNR